jgi:hypothetical protein
MRRLALLVLALALVAPALLVPARAAAAVPCRNRIYNDWYADGKIATTYPIGCYRDALEHVKADARIYSSLVDDIRSAMQGALARRRGGSDVPAQVGKGGASGVSPAVQTLHSTTTSTLPGPTTTADPTTESPQTQTVADAATSGGGGGVPTPILVLGGLALLLAAAGAAGAGFRRLRRR